MFCTGSATSGLPSRTTPCCLPLLANRLGLPLLVFESLGWTCPQANGRHRAFLLEGAPETAASLREFGTGRVFRSSPSQHPFLPDAAAVVTDDYPEALSGPLPALDVQATPWIPVAWRRPVASGNGRMRRIRSGRRSTNCCRNFSNSRKRRGFDGRAWRPRLDPVRSPGRSAIPSGRRPPFTAAAPRPSVIFAASSKIVCIAIPGTRTSRRPTAPPA